MWQYTYTDELYHYGVKGMKWGVRRKQRKHEKLLKSRDAKYVYKHRNELSDDEYDRVFRKLSQDRELKKMAYGEKKERSAAKEIAVSAGKEAAKIAVKALAVAGTAYYLTQTNSGKALVNKGKSAVTNMIKDAAKASARNMGDVAKTTAETAKKVVTNTVSDARTRAAKSYTKSMQSGNKAAKALYNYGRTVDKFVRR